MKKIIILTAFLAINHMAFSQCSLPYKSLEQFNNDTTAFITYNFYTRAACYVGKTMKDVINDLGLPVKSFLPTNGIQNTNYCDGLYIFIYPYQTVNKYIAKKDMHNFIAINWTTLIPEDSLNAIKDSSDRHKWTPQIADLLKDAVISEMDIVHGIR